MKDNHHNVRQLPDRSRNIVPLMNSMVKKLSPLVEGDDGPSGELNFVFLKLKNNRVKKIK